MGAVMGSKNLKAVAVKGNNQVPLVDSQTYAQLRMQSNRELRLDSVTRVLRDLGTANAAEYFDYLGFQPKRYYQYSKMEQEIQIGGSVISENLLDGISACHACVIACGRVVKLEDGIRRKGPEYETLVGFGPNLGLNDPTTATRLGEWCDRYGMDSISLSNTIGFAIKLFDEGKITLQDTGGLELKWGDPTIVEQLIHLIARREGFGDYLARGSRALGSSFGAEEEAVQVKGLEVPYHDPRGSSGMALVYATSPTGANHNQSDYFLADIGQVETSLGMNYYDPRSGVEKAANVARHQDWRTVSHALVLCIFANVPPETVVNLVNAACGFDWNIEELMLTGERGWNLKRLINMRLGLTRADDRLPKAFLTPFLDDPEGFVPDFQAMLEAYYQARGWDLSTGFPSQDKLNQLGLEWALQVNH
jgi:aldehyde:ferredoxin oxidoreductase